MYNLLMENITKMLETIPEDYTIFDDIEEKDTVDNIEDDESEEINEDNFYINTDIFI